MSKQENVFDIFTGKLASKPETKPEPEYMYRLYTEDKGDETTDKLVRHVEARFATGGLTYYRAKGIWRGEPENALIIAITTADEPEPQEWFRGLPETIFRASNFIIGYLEQEAVGVELPDGRFELIYSLIPWK